LNQGFAAEALDADVFAHVGLGMNEKMYICRQHLIWRF
jgi:hypothetical protein